jgi:hypothetical protein
MMRRKVETTRIARVCQVASLLLVLGIVLGMGTHDVMHGPGNTAQREATRLAP